jgi:ethanolamine utilization protein EutN
MILALVVGNVTSPIQIPDLDARTLLLVQPITPTGEHSTNARIAIDTVGAGEGDRVLIIDEGNSGRQILSLTGAPVKTLVVGVVDQVEIGGVSVYDHCSDANTDASRVADTGAKT